MIFHEVNPECAGFSNLVPVLPVGETLELPVAQAIDIALLDYRLGETLTAVEVSRMVKAKFPSAAIVVLSDMMYMPDDVSPSSAKVNPNSFWVL